MKRSKKLLGVVFTVLIVFCLFATPAAAITEGDVQGQVNSQGREAVAGNVFVWFLCAIGFLKISQKIDSFMSSLGINVGHTGGSMLAEAVIAARGVSIGKQALGAGSGARRAINQKSVIALYPYRLHCRTTSRSISLVPPST